MVPQVGFEPNVTDDLRCPKVSERRKAHLSKLQLKTI